MKAPEVCGICGKLAFPEEMVTIPAAEYREVLARPPPDQPFMGKPIRQGVAADVEVADFIVRLAAPGTMIAREIAEAVRERFGEERTPSQTALYRFLAQCAKGKRPPLVRARE